MNADVVTYGTTLFPAEEIWKFYTPVLPTPGNVEEECCAAFIDLTAHKAELRDWRFGINAVTGDISGAFSCSSANVLRQYVSQTSTGRYDAGAIRLGPTVETIRSSPCLQKHIVVDFDATDYKEFREFCGCGQVRSKMCYRCIALIRTAAQATVAILKTVWGYRHIGTYYTGARGLHLRVCDFTATIQSATLRDQLAEMLQGATIDKDLSSLCYELKQFEAKTRKPLSILIDANVTRQMEKQTRGPFSVHEQTSRVYWPLESPDEFTRMDVAPLLKDVINPQNAAAMEELFDVAKRRLVSVHPNYISDH